MRITMVKKIKLDGSPCRKCAEVEERLQTDNYIDRIDQIIIADERDPSSEGMQIAERYSVDRAPFFMVEEAGEEAKIYTVYFKFLKEILRA